MEAPPMENRSRSDIACPLAAVMFDAGGAKKGFTIRRFMTVTKVCSQLGACREF